MKRSWWMLMMASVVGTAAVVARQLPADKVPASARKSYQTKFPGDRARLQELQDH
jgi:hypothetical protein